MSVCAPCPDRERLRDLLDGALPDEEQADLTRHLDSCTSCQQQLEGLAAAGSWVGPGPWLRPEPVRVVVVEWPWFLRFFMLL